MKNKKEEEEEESERKEEYLIFLFSFITIPIVVLPLSDFDCYFRELDFIQANWTSWLTFVDHRRCRIIKVSALLMRIMRTTEAIRPSSPMYL